jgi:hypothetical protein
MADNKDEPQADIESLLPQVTEGEWRYIQIANALNELMWKQIWKRWPGGDGHEGG